MPYIQLDDEKRIVTVIHEPTDNVNTDGMVEISSVPDGFIHDYSYIDGVFVLHEDTHPVPQEEESDDVVAARMYLKLTDWVVTKITETQLKGQDISGLVAKYEHILTKREAVRAVIPSDPSEG